MNFKQNIHITNRDSEFDRIEEHIHEKLMFPIPVASVIISPKQRRLSQPLQTGI